MLPFPKIARKRVLLASVLGVMLLGVAAYFAGYLSWSDGLRPPPAEVARQDTKIKIAVDTELIQKIIYQKCADEEVFRTKPADNLVGLNLGQVQKVYAGWTIDKFTPREVEMSLAVNSYCREHANNMFIGLKDGFVAVFYGKPGPRAIIREVTRIPVADLSPEDQEELKHGLVVQSREEVLRTLEGMQSR
jgi:hypothetical protein